MPKVSFILPAYKRRFLKEAIDSILAQTCRDFELVVVDDKSPEALYEVIKEYPWEKDFDTLPDGGRKWEVDGIPVRYYQNLKNLGGERVVDAWHHALTYANSDLCVLAGDDDVYCQRFLGEMMRLEQKYPKCDMFFSRSATIDESGAWKSVGAKWLEHESQISLAYYNGIRHMPIFAQAVMFRKSKLMDIGGFVDFPNAAYSDDATWMLLSRNGAAVSPEILFHWRYSGKNLSTRTDNVLPKLQACEKYRFWMTSFVRELKPANDEERLLLARIQSELHSAINLHARQYIGMISSFAVWFRTLRSSPQSPSLKREFVYDRFPRLRALRMLLPHFNLWRRK